MPLAQPPRSAEDSRYASWDRARMSVVVPVGVIVAVAIICIVVAVLSSAHRADQMAVAREMQLLRRELDARGERVLREVESVVSSQSAIKHIRMAFDPAWTSRRVGAWLQTFFEHDYVMVFDGEDRSLFAQLDTRHADADLVHRITSDLRPVLDYMRGRAPNLRHGIGIHDASASEGGAHPRISLIMRFLNRPAAIAAVAVGPVDGIPPSLDNRAPIVASIKFIDDKLLEDIGAQLRMTNLHLVGERPPRAGDVDYVLADPTGRPIARFAWAPKQPGAEIVDSVTPFIVVALCGFALLAGFVLRYMRRTAAAIAASESRLRYLAMHDPLCGLPNRIFFGERLEEVIDEVANGAPPAVVFYIDLDHFKDVNDTLGHPVGDELIRNVTLRLSRMVREGDLVARLGGDEFAVISSIGDDHGRIMLLAERIIRAICAPYLINGQNIVIGASIGIAVIDKKCAGAADILRYADMALYRAKNEGRNRACIYDAAMDADLSKRKLLESDLREAIENDRLQLLYQPIVNNSGEKLVGVEALCRWTDAARGEIAPSEFIAIAEHSGLIIELGAWVLRRAMTDGKAWPGVNVAVNVSSLQFRRADFVDMVERTLAETEFDPARLELELTESVLIGNVDIAESSMLRLKALGVRIALDDFGTGYSSLLYLRRFPFDKLKIDRSFVRSIEKAADAAAIVHAVVSLGRGLGMQVTAEGVETADQHLFLRAAGVHAMQGYRFGKAVTAAEITVRLQTPAGPAQRDARLAS